MSYLRIYRWWTAGTPWTLWTLCCLARARDPSDAAAVMYTTSSFRLGSGAPLGSDLGGAPLPEAPLQHGGHLPFAIVTNPLGTRRPLRTEGSGERHLSEAVALPSTMSGTRPWSRLYIVIALLPFAAISVLGNMMAPGAGGLTPGGRDNFNYRIPPAWSPENENHYSFRAYMADIFLWILLTDL